MVFHAIVLTENHTHSPPSIVIVHLMQLSVPGGRRLDLDHAECSCSRNAMLCPFPYNLVGGFWTNATTWLQKEHTTSMFRVSRNVF